MEFVVDDATPKPVLRPALTSKSLSDATTRYSTTAVLRKLLTHDEERGGGCGVPPLPPWCRRCGEGLRQGGGDGLEPGPREAAQ